MKLITQEGFQTCPCILVELPPLPLKHKFWISGPWGHWCFCNIYPQASNRQLFSHYVELFMRSHIMVYADSRRLSSPQIKPSPHLESASSTNQNACEVVPTASLASIFGEAPCFGVSQPGAANKNHPLFVFVNHLDEQFLCGSSQTALACFQVKCINYTLPSLQAARRPRLSGRISSECANLHQWAA